MSHYTETETAQLEAGIAKLRTMRSDLSETTRHRPLDDGERELYLALGSLIRVAGAELDRLAEQALE